VLLFGRELAEGLAVGAAAEAAVDVSAADVATGAEALEGLVVEASDEMLGAAASRLLQPHASSTHPKSTNIFEVIVPSLSFAEQASTSLLRLRRTTRQPSALAEQAQQDHKAS